jgi:SAM-dependent methyltransferase
MKDTYIHDMDWCIDARGFHLPNYRAYQYGLVENYIGREILEVGTGDKEFTRLLQKNNADIKKCISIEPSHSFFSAFSIKKFPKPFTFLQLDLFQMTKKMYGDFDTVLFIHVLEHIKEDKQALDHTYKLLQKGGHALIMVPALPILFSDHDVSLGHYRRYTKASMKRIINRNKFIIEDMWYQDFFGTIGSFFYFKLPKIRLKTPRGIKLVRTNGQIYDKYIIPLERRIEKYIRFPIGLTLTAILKKR